MGEAMPIRKFKITVLVLGLLFGLGFTQNCTKTKLASARNSESEAPQNNGGIGGYDGKTLIHYDTCPGGGVAIESKIEVDEYGVPSLTEENCALLNPPHTLAPTEVVATRADSDVYIYENKIFD